jgi:AraC-like DNA-binding protein/tetratricopeptide (TPR) repeat protein
MINFITYCLLFFFFLFWGCKSPKPEHPELIEQAIVSFYNENENEEVLNVLAKSDSVLLNNQSEELIKILKAAALCELWQADNSWQIISTIDEGSVYKSNKVWYYSIRGLIQFRQSKTSESYQSLITANKFDYADIRPIALNQRILARIAFQLDDHENGMRWLALSTRNFKAAELAKSVAVNEKILGRYYMNTGNFDEALRSFLSAENVFRSYNDHAELFYIYINLIDYHIKTGDYDRAEEYAVKCLNQCDTTTNNTMKTLVYNNLGEIALNQHKLDKSISYYQQTIATEPGFNGEFVRKASAHLQLSRVYRKKTDFSKALTEARQAAFLLPVEGHIAMRREIYQELALIQLESGSLGDGLKYLDTTIVLTDSTFKSITKSGEAYFNTKTRLVELENNMQELRHSERRKRNTFIILISLMAILAIFVSVIYFQQRSKTAVLKALAKKNLELLEDERKLSEMKHFENLQKRANRSANGNGKSEQLFAELTQWLTNNRNYARKELNLEFAARELGTNRDYLSKAINENNFRFNDLVNKFRVEEAIRIFADKSDIRNKYGLVVISSEVGFNSNSVFIDAFRKFSGMTPAQFRDSLGQQNKL